MNKLQKCVPLLAVGFVLLFMLPSPVLASEADASGAIASAKQEIITCYQATRDAEAAGANVTSLTLALNNAGILLSDAEWAYSRSDFDGALDLATSSRASLSNLVSAANALRDISFQQQRQDFTINIVGSTAGALAIIATGAVTLFVLKRKHAQTGEQTHESDTV